MMSALRVRRVCPNCSSPIEPTLFQCLPPRSSRRQFRCPKCDAWLTIDGPSRVLMVAVGTISCTSVAMPMLQLKAPHGIPPAERAVVAVFIAAVPIAISIFVVALVLRKFAVWVLSPKKEL